MIPQQQKKQLGNRQQPTQEQASMYALMEKNDSKSLMGVKDLYKFFCENVSEAKPTTYASRENATQVSRRIFHLVGKDEVKHTLKADADYLSRV